MSILVVGSVAIDSLKTPFGERREALGGSATYFSIAASLFNKVNIVAVVGEDFPKRYISLFRKRRIGIEGLQVAKGKTFRWKGYYDYDLNTAHTVYTHLNVFRDFRPEIPRGLECSPHVFLANIDPDLQHSVLAEMRRPRLVACDSMNYWIENKKKSLRRLLREVDIFLLNDGEARLLTGEYNLVKAARAVMKMGPKAVVVKKGEHGVIYFSKTSHFVAPAYLLETVYDPTGAGDTFAGGMIGYLSARPRIDEYEIRRAIVHGSVMASFAVSDFSVDGLLKVSPKAIRARYNDFKKITLF